MQISKSTQERYLRLNKETMQFLNICFLFTLFKLKEYSQAYSLAKDLALSIEREPASDQ